MKIKALFLSLALFFGASIASASAQSYTPIGSPDFFEGDSIIFGFGATSCSAVLKTVVTPAGTCMADLIAIHDGARELNVGVGGTCLVFTTTVSSACNQSSVTTGSLIKRYQSDLALVAPGMRVYLQIGTNDVFAWSTGDTQVSPATFRANLATVASAFASVVGSKNLILGEIPYQPASFQANVNALNAQIADVATQFGYLLATNSSTIQNCAISTPSDTNFCSYDRTHPDDNGYAAMALVWESANYASAVSASDSQRKALALNFLPNSSTNTNLGGRAVLALLTTGLRNVCAGNNACNQLTSGNDNFGFGNFALGSISTSSNNVAIGSSSLLSTSGQGNVAIGFQAGSSFSVENFNTYIGQNTQSAGNLDSNETVIGNGATGRGSNTVTLGGGVVTVNTQGGYCPGNGTTFGTPCYYSGTGVPAFPAPNGSQYLRFDGATGTRVYYNTSGASTSGTTWSAQAAP